MARGLWVLLWLRAWAGVRHWARGLRTLKGVGSTLVLAAIFLPVLVYWPIKVCLDGRPLDAEGLELIRRFGPMVLLALLVVPLVTSPGEGAVTFSPAEVNFLFAGPFSRRQLLGYKVAQIGFLSLLGALFLTVSVGVAVSPLLSAFLGCLLLLVFVQLAYLLVVLVVRVVGARVYSRWRRGVWTGAAGVVLVGVVWASIGPGGVRARDLLDAAERNAAWRVLGGPLRWFFEALTAQTVWPDLVWWTVPCALVDAVMLLAVFAVDAHYLEASAAASERLYEQAEKLRRGGAAALGFRASRRVRFSLPMPPGWEGVGPLAWRQGLAVLRNPSRLLVLVLFFGCTFGFIPGILRILPLLDLDGPGGGPNVAAWGLGVLVVVMGVLCIGTFTEMIAFDFRSDLHRLDVLKALPVAPAAVAAGQLLVPVTLTAFLQCVALGTFQVAVGGLPPVVWAAWAFLIPADTVLLGVENILFLSWPARDTGHQLLRFVGKAFWQSCVLVLLAVAGLGTYAATGGSVFAALVVVWFLLLGLAGVAVAMTASAFQRFDPARADEEGAR